PVRTHDHEHHGVAYREVGQAPGGAAAEQCHQLGVGRTHHDAHLHAAAGAAALKIFPVEGVLQAAEGAVLQVWLHAGGHDPGAGVGREAVLVGPVVVCRQPHGIQVRLHPGHDRVVANVDVLEHRDGG